MKKFPIALQVYSVRDDAAADFRGTMEKVKAMGYDGVELAGLYDLAPAEISAILKEVGLVALSAHVPYQTIIADMQKAIDDYKEIGCQYIAVPYLQEDERPGTAGYAAVYENIKKFGALCHENGVTLLYHNHDFEFTKVEDGRYALDYMYETIPATDLQTELDTCWVKVAGEDPAAYIRKYANRCPLVHLKDFQLNGEKPAQMYELIGIETNPNATPRGTFDFMPVGYGMQNMPAILEAAEESGALWVVVEQDRSKDEPPIVAVEKSIKYLKSLGL